MAASLLDLSITVFCSPPRSEPKCQPFCLLGLFDVAVGAWRCRAVLVGARGGRGAEGRHRPWIGSIAGCGRSALRSSGLKYRCF